MTGPGETRLKQNIKEASRLGEASFDDWEIGLDDYGEDKYRPGDELNFESEEGY